MARKKLDITRHTLNLRAGDYEFLQDFCQGKDIEASEIIRAQISKAVDTLRERSNKAKKATVEVDL